MAKVKQRETKKGKKDRDGQRNDSKEKEIERDQRKGKRRKRNK